jgi:hypothetical protein
MAWGCRFRATSSRCSRPHRLVQRTCLAVQRQAEIEAPFDFLAPGNESVGDCMMAFLTASRLLVA